MAFAVAIDGPRQTADVTVANGASLSDAADCRRHRIVGLIYDSGWDSAITTFQASIDNSTFNNVYDGYGPTELQIAARSAAGYVGLTAEQQVALMGADYVKVRSGTSGSATNQSGATVVTLVMVPL